MDSSRALRLLTLLGASLAIPQNIALTIINRSKAAWIIAFVPLSVTVATSIISIVVFRRHGRMPNFSISLLDLFAILFYIGVLIPIWAVEVGKMRLIGYGLLAGYMTAPMIVNMFAHLYFFCANVNALRSWMCKKAEHECPNCHSKFVLPVPSKTPETVQRGEGYSLLRGEGYFDGDAPQYNDERTSEDLVGPKGQGDEESKGKGPISI